MGPELETGPITIPRRLRSRRSLNVGQRGDLSHELRLDPMHEVNLRAAHEASPPRRSAPGPKPNSAQIFGGRARQDDTGHCYVIVFLLIHKGAATVPVFVIPFTERLRAASSSSASDPKQAFQVGSNKGWNAPLADLRLLPDHSSVLAVSVAGTGYKLVTAPGHDVDPAFPGSPRHCPSSPRRGQARPAPNRVGPAVLLDSSGRTPLALDWRATSNGAIMAEPLIAASPTLPTPLQGAGAQRRRGGHRPAPRREVLHARRATIIVASASPSCARQ